MEKFSFSLGLPLIFACMDEILLSVTLLSDGKIITWYDLSKKCSIPIMCRSHLFGCFHPSHRSYSPLYSLFEWRKHLKKYEAQIIPSCFFYRHLISIPFGMYCLISLLVFSTAPFCQKEYASVKNTGTPSLSVIHSCAENSLLSWMFAFIAFPPDVIARTSGISGLGNYCVGKDV